MKQRSTISCRTEETSLLSRAEPEPPCILCVDDNELVRDGICEGLASKGWRCKTASGGKTALKWLTTNRSETHFIITDHKMPDMNGLEFVENLRATDFTGKIVVHSSMLTRGEMTAYQQLKVDAIIDKNGDLEPLAEAIVKLQVNQPMIPGRR